MMEWTCPVTTRRRQHICLSIELRIGSVKDTYAGWTVINTIIKYREKRCLYPEEPLDVIDIDLET